MTIYSTKDFVNFKRHKFKKIQKSDERFRNFVSFAFIFNIISRDSLLMDVVILVFILFSLLYTVKGYDDIMK